MNLATKRTPWLGVLLLAVTSIFGDGKNMQQGSCPPPPPSSRCPLQAPQQPMQSAYNAPAEINIGREGDIDVFLTGSFIYWQPSLDNVTAGWVLNQTNVAIYTASFTSVEAVSLSGNLIDMDYSFKPGFQVGAGMNLQIDDWYGYSEYTRVHGEHNVSSNGTAGGSPTIVCTWGAPYLTSGNGPGGGCLFNSVSMSYNNNLDFVDAEMGRTYYVGKDLIVRSAYGARAAFITQNVHVHYLNTTSQKTNDANGKVLSMPSILDVYERNHSWGLGPRGGVEMDWTLVGGGFRFFGSGYGDILYTKYKIQDKSVVMATTVANGNLFIGQPVSLVSKEKPGLLRAHLEFAMGLGWGSYFDNNNWHVDFSAAYEWQVFFDQAMFRAWTDPATLGMNTLDRGNLYVQGLTTTVRMDF